MYQKYYDVLKKYVVQEMEDEEYYPKYDFTGDKPKIK